MPSEARALMSDLKQYNKIVEEECLFDISRSGKFGGLPATCFRRWPSHGANETAELDGDLGDLPRDSEYIDVRLNKKITGNVKGHNFRRLP